MRSAFEKLFALDASEQLSLGIVLFYKTIARIFIVIGFIGILAGIYDLLNMKWPQLAFGLITYAFGFSVFGWIFLTVSKILQKINSNMQLTKSEQDWLHNLKPVRGLAKLLFVAGFIGLALSAYGLLAQWNLFDKIRSLFLFYSLNFVFSSFILYRECIILSLRNDNTDV